MICCCGGLAICGDAPLSPGSAPYPVFTCWRQQKPRRIAPAGLSYLLVSATYGRLFTQLSTSFFTWSFAVP
jgi:hypothetical protein